MKSSIKIEDIIALDKKLQTLLNSEDNTGCSDDLTVVSKQALQNVTECVNEILHQARKARKNRKKNITKYFKIKHTPTSTEINRLKDGKFLYWDRYSSSWAKGFDITNPGFVRITRDEARKLYPKAFKKVA